MQHIAKDMLLCIQKLNKNVILYIYIYEILLCIIYYKIYIYIHVYDIYHNIYISTREWSMIWYAYMSYHTISLRTSNNELNEKRDFITLMIQFPLLKNILYIYILYIFIILYTLILYEKWILYEVRISYIFI